MEVIWQLETTELEGHIYYEVNLLLIINQRSSNIMTGHPAAYCLINHKTVSTALPCTLSLQFPTVQYSVLITISCADINSQNAAQTSWTRKGQIFFWLLCFGFGNIFLCQHRFKCNKKFYFQRIYTQQSNQV